MVNARGRILALDSLRRSNESARLCKNKPSDFENSYRNKLLNEAKFYRRLIDFVYRRSYHSNFNIKDLVEETIKSYIDRSSKEDSTDIGLPSKPILNVVIEEIRSIDSDRVDEFEKSDASCRRDEMKKVSLNSEFNGSCANAFEGIGALLSAARTDAGLSQTQVAAAMGTGESAIRRLEKGSGNPTIATLQKYANVVGAKISLEIDTGPDSAAP